VIIVSCICPSLPHYLGIHLMHPSNNAVLS
jgi:hypothetical protein